MHRKLPPNFVAVAVGLFVCAVISPSLAQGIESYSLVHPFGLASATTTRQFGMGAPISCVWDRGFANPAFAAMQDEPNASLRLSSTDFERGPDLVSKHLHVVYPLESNERGLQLSLFNLSSNSGSSVTPGVGPSFVDMSEEDISIHYGQRFSDRFTAGIGLSPMSEIDFSLAAAGGPTLINIEAKSDIGARIGAAYEWAPGDFIGLVYDYYQETATASVPGLLPQSASASFSRVFHTDLIALGISSHFAENLIVAAEFQRGSSFDGAYEGSINGMHIGAEYLPKENLALRAGLNDERATAGFGYADERWQIDYAYANRWNDDIAGAFFGGSDTHQIQVIGRW